MKVPLQITVRDIENTPELENDIREKTEKLHQFFNDIVSCHVVIDLEKKGHQHGNEHNVHIDLAVPGKTIVVSKKTHENLSIALRDAFNAARRQLEDYATKS